ncbi:MAG: radical SAM protein [Burkholderiales bacterium]|nr:radical SAM protein [Burkholderiales bacterium]
MPLNINEHSRGSAGLTYVYPVVSRRSGGVSVGINLNPNNACNWRCVYCQVPELKLGAAPQIDLDKLEGELSGFLYELLHGDFMNERVPEDLRRINDVAISGNGEPTSALEFDSIVERIGEVILDSELPLDVRLVLITNGSLIHKQQVRAGLNRMASLNGEVWFKLDSATVSGRKRINDTAIGSDLVLGNLEICASLCPTWLQTCVFQLDGHPPSGEEREAYIEFVSPLAKDLKGVLLYGLARKSCQAEAARLSPVSREWIAQFGDDIRKAGLAVRIFL